MMVARTIRFGAARKKQLNIKVYRKLNTEGMLWVLVYVRPRRYDLNVVVKIELKMEWKYGQKFTSSSSLTL